MTINPKRSGPRIAAAPIRVAMHSAQRMAQASRIAATPRIRGRKLQQRRIAWLSAHPLCCDCTAEGRATLAQEVDHEVPLWAGGADDDTNFASRCIEHHKAKTAREASERARGLPRSA